MKNEFMWCDIEATGLINDKPGGLYAGGQILELAVAWCNDWRGGDMAITSDLSVVVHHEPDVLAMNPFARDMHTKSGLLAEVASSGVDLDTLDEYLFEEACKVAETRLPMNLTLAGNSVHFDLAWIRVQLPHFASTLSHRVFDVSTLQRALMSWKVGGYERIPAKCHRALDDVNDSIRAAKAWREAVGL